MDKLFHRTNWAEVKEGDVVLFAVGEDLILEARVTQISAGEDVANIFVTLNPTGFSTHYHRRRAPDVSVYVQSRL